MPDPTDAGSCPSSGEARRGDALARVLGEIQRRGGIGRGPVEAAIDHARQFVAALPDEPGVLVDLGSGGGLPGLVIAHEAPAWSLVLVERRAKRADLLRYGVHTLELDDRVRILAEDAADACRRPELVRAAHVVTARSFAPPLEVLATAHPFLRPGGLIILSEPPESRVDRWDRLDVVTLGMHDLGRRAGVRTFELRH